MFSHSYKLFLFMSVLLGGFAHAGSRGGGGSFSSGRSSYGGSGSGSFGGSSMRSYSAPARSYSAPAPAPTRSWSYGGTATSSLGTTRTAPASPAPASPTPTRSWWPSSSSTSAAPKPAALQDAPKRSWWNPTRPAAAPANPYAGRTEVKTNRDGSSSTRYYDSQNKLRETNVVKDGRTVQSFKRDDRGEEVHTYANSSVRVTRSGNTVRKEFSDGRVMETSKTIDPRSGNSIYYRRGSPNRYEYRNVDFGGRPTEVYVTRNSSTLDNPWFWMYLMNNHNNNNNNGGGGYSGGSYAYAPSQAAPAPLVTEDWRQTYAKLPQKYQGQRKYSETLDWVTDYVTFGIINDNMPERGWFDTHFCFFHTCADPKTDYDIDLQTRARLKTQIASTLEALKNKQEVNLYKLMGPQGLDPSAKGYLVVADDETDAKQTDDQSRCMINSGAILSLDDYNADSGVVNATVLMQGDLDGDVCAVGKQVSLDATIAQKFQNQFLSLLDNAVTKAAQQFASVKGSSK